MCHCHDFTRIPRTPSISDADYQRHLQRLRELGYAPEQVRRVPQAWPEQAAHP
ncbi:MAG: hypothetical protein ACREVW_11035 [Burkholderiales bacterium]